VTTLTRQNVVEAVAQPVGFYTEARELNGGNPGMDRMTGDVTALTEQFRP
jgi:hypothetical protein